MTVNDLYKIAVIGTGMIGPDISLACAMYGCPVEIIGLDNEHINRGMERIRKNAGYLVAERVLSQAEAEKILGRIDTSTNLEQSVSKADLIYEAITEKLEAKQKLFQVLDKCCQSHAIMASSTSGLSPTDISSNTQSRDRMLVTHFWNPPFLVPLVEVVVHEHTSQETIDSMLEYLRGLGKTPVLLKKDCLGHIGNRLQHALFREAIHIIEQGIADPEDIDNVVLNSLGPRYSMIGPMEYIDSTGIDLLSAIHSYLLADLADDKKPQKSIEEMLERRDIGFKTGKGFYNWQNRDPNEMVLRQNKRFIDRLREIGRFKT